MAAGEAGPLVFIDDMIADRNNKISSEVHYGAVLMLGLLQMLQNRLDSASHCKW